MRPWQILWKAEALILAVLVGCSAISPGVRVESGAGGTNPCPHPPHRYGGAGGGDTGGRHPSHPENGDCRHTGWFQFDDVYVPQRWHLDTPIDHQGHKVHDWDFKRGTPVHVEGRLKIPIEIAGKPLDFSEAGIRVPVVHVKVASMLAERAPGDVQLIPADIEGQPDQYLVLVATRLIRCIDEEASEVSFWTPAHGVPEKVGQYMGVDRLRIDKVKVGNAKVFRPEGWEVATRFEEV